MYQDLTIPLSKYREVAVHNNKAALIIEGYPSPEDIETAWQNIQQEFADKMGGADSILYFKTYKQIYQLVISIEQVKFLLEFLAQHSDPYFESELNRHLFTNFDFKENRERDLKKCRTFAKQLNLKLQLKQAEYKALEEKNHQQPGERPTDEYFISMLIRLSNHAKFPIPETITTYEFCERVTDLISYIKQLEIENAKNKPTK